MNVAVSNSDLGFLNGGDTISRLMRDRDWSQSPLGVPQHWPQPLRLIVSLMLSSKFPMFVAWGPELGFLYNDAYADILGTKHPHALGARFEDVWHEIWPDILPLVEAAMRGEAIYRQDLPLVMHRSGFDEQTWFTFSYSPARDENGQVAGMFCACSETTARVQAERALSESEARFRNMADHAPVIMWVTDQAGYCHYLNRAWYRFTGQTQQEAEGFGWLEATHPDDKEHAEQVFREANAARASFKTEYRLRRSDGTYHWVLDAASPRFGSDGEYLGYVGSVVDIDERRGHEDRQRESEAALRTLTNALPAFVWFATPDGELHYFNDRWYEYTHQTPEEALPNGWVSTLHPDDVEETAWRWKEARANGHTYVTEIRYRRHDGAYRWYVARAEPLRDEEGVVTGWVGSSIDIHDRKVAEAKLQELNQTLERRIEAALAERKILAEIVEGTDALVEVIDPDFRLLAVNKAAVEEFEHLYGRRPKVGDNVLDLLADHQGDRASVQAVWERALSGEEFTEVGPFGDPQRVQRYYEMKFNALRDEDGKLVAAYRFVEDVTERMEEQERLRAAEEALRQSQKMEAMGQLTGGVAHDFNNLLTPIVGSLDMLQRRGFGGEREQRMISGAIQSAERAKLLVQRLLAFARRQPLQAVPVDMAKLVSGMQDLITSTTGPQIKIGIHIPPDLGPAKADPNQVEMALLNLSVNARDAMPQGGTLTISASEEHVRDDSRPGLRPGHYIRLSVADTGSGMDDATLARAVEPFFSTKGVGRGTGLGLSMVHGLASQLGGALTVSSREGEGTNVELWLPRSTEKVPEVGPVEPESSVPLQTQTTALLVDDEELVRLSAVDMLHDLGYRVIEAASAEDALMIIDQGQPFDVLITDHLMPGMSGTELVQVVRMRRPGTPALLVSGYAELRGIDPKLPRLTKPFRKSELAEVLGTLQNQY